jgi:hypothetical protein
MAQHSGTAGSVVAGTIVVGEMTEWSLDITSTTVETTSFGEVWQEYLPSIRGATGSFSGNWDTADAGQVALWSSLIGGSAVTFKLYTTAAKYLSGASYLTGAGHTISNAGIGQTTWSFQVSGSVALV